MRTPERKEEVSNAAKKNSACAYISIETIFIIDMKRMVNAKTPFGSNVGPPPAES